MQIEASEDGNVIFFLNGKTLGSAFVGLKPKNAIFPIVYLREAGDEILVLD